MIRVGFLAAQENRDAVMPARDDEPVAQRAQPHCAPAAKAVGQHHGVDVRTCVHGFEVLLQLGA